MSKSSRVAVQARLYVFHCVIVALVSASAIAISVSCASHTGTGEATPKDAPKTEPSARVVPTTIATPPVMPPFKVSDEATSAQLERAVDEGNAVGRELEWVKREEAVASGEMAAGEYVVTYMITPADDYYDLEAADSKMPAHHTTVMPGSAHVAVVVRDAADGRMVSGLTVTASLSSGTVRGQRREILPFGWHPILNRYGENIVLPANPFTLTVHIGMPKYPRHDRVNGDRFVGDVVARFANISVSLDSLAAAAQRLARGNTRDAIDLSRQEGTPVTSALAFESKNSPTHVSQRRVGDYTVSVVFERARGAWQLQAGKLAYATPTSSIGAVNHIEISIRDAATGRLLPGLNVRATILDSRKREIDTYAMPFMWHPWMSHYGLNVAVPGNGRYMIRVRAEAPAFRRYGSSALKAFNSAIDVEMRGLRFVTVTN